MGLTQVSTSGIKDATVATADIADQAITLAKLPHGDGSSDGKFLRANNGADPSFETVTSTTINNNADNRVITGSASANTLNGESTLTWNGTLLDINQSGTVDTGLKLRNSEGGLYVRANDDITFIDTDHLRIRNEAETERLRIDSSGRVGIGLTNAAAELDIATSVEDGSGTLAEHGIRLSHVGATDEEVIPISGGFVTQTGRVRAGIGFISKQASSTEGYAGAIGFYTRSSADGNGLLRTDERMRIDQSGRIGIGTTSPDAPLTIHSSSDPEIRFGYNSSQDHRLGWDSSKVRLSADPDNANSGSALLLDVDGSTRLYINDSGDVGIGTTNPQKSLHVYESGVATIQLETGDSRGQAFNILSTNGAQNNTGTLSIRNEAGQSFIDFSHNEGSPFTKIYNTGSEQFRFDADGIKFNGDSAAANGLDDYEEGTWTPDWRGASALGTTTYGSYNAASYVKVGNQVTVRGYSEINGSSGGSGIWFINNLPFTVGGGDNRAYRSVGSVMIENFNMQDSENGGDILCFVERNNNDLQLRGNRDNEHASNNIKVNQDTNFEVFFTITYPTA